MMKSGFRIALAVILLWAVSGRAQDNAFSPKTQVELLLRILASDANLALRCPEGLRIGVVSLSGDAKANAAAQKVLDEFRANEGMKIKRLSVRAERCEVPDAETLFRMVDERALNILYLSPGSDPILRQVVDFARLKKVFLVSGEAGYAWAGVPLAVVEENSATRILVNLEAVGELSAKFDAQLLSQLAAAGTQYLHQKPEEIRKRRISGSDPEYPLTAMRQERQAVLVARVFITADGSVEKIAFIQTHPQFETTVRRAVMNWKFSPLLIGGIKMPTNTIYKFTFETQ